MFLRKVFKSAALVSKTFVFHKTEQTTLTSASPQVILYFAAFGSFTFFLWTGRVDKIIYQQRENWADMQLASWRFCQQPGLASEDGLLHLGLISFNYATLIMPDFHTTPMVVSSQGLCCSQGFPDIPPLFPERNILILVPNLGHWRMKFSTKEEIQEIFSSFIFLFHKLFGGHSPK